MNVQKFMSMKGKEQIVLITAYDAPFANIVHQAGVDAILVGDSVANNVLGYSDTLAATMEDMIRHTQAVRRGAPEAFIIADMPFLSYQCSHDEAVKNAGRFLKEAGANAVKLEGGSFYAPLIERLVKAGIPVMGHLGLTPQSVNLFGGYKVQGKTEKSAEYLLEEAKAIEKAGVFSIVLEMVVEETAKRITENLTVPTIGIGSGRYCDGQVLVLHDLLGLNPSFLPKFAKRYANLYQTSLEAVQKYALEVRSRTFPSEENVFKAGGGS
ncbi:3-methyl-2-oxobutanoate hydroxymethyltransferase [Pseudothermotoga sp. U03pept]|uniref:3-methyl-2-oxobutanoate hydroxymethyltransferase n=1 Tax=Pseudothermotoga sp. U03pept TaxID=3447012 RepID=UPI003F01852B